MQFRPTQFGQTDARELLKVNKNPLTEFDIPDLYARTRLQDNEEALLFAEAISECLEFEDWDGLKEIDMLLTLLISEGGKARHEFVEAVTGVIWDPQMARRLGRRDQKRTNDGYNSPPTS